MRGEGREDEVLWQALIASVAGKTLQYILCVRAWCMQQWSVVQQQLVAPADGKCLQWQHRIQLELLLLNFVSALAYLHFPFPIFHFHFKLFGSVFILFMYIFHLALVIFILDGMPHAVYYGIRHVACGMRHAACGISVCATRHIISEHTLAHIISELPNEIRLQHSTARRGAGAVAGAILWQHSSLTE